MGSYQLFSTSRSTQCSRNSTRRFPRKGSSSRGSPDKLLDTRGSFSVGQVVADTASVAAAHKSQSAMSVAHNCPRESYRRSSLGRILPLVWLLPITAWTWWRIIALRWLLRIALLGVAATLGRILLMTRRSLTVVGVGAHGCAGGSSVRKPRKCQVLGAKRVELRSRGVEEEKEGEKRTGLQVSRKFGTNRRY
ncbi:hypothetical protein BJX99DRAFT_233836 [Aspergillus californicus]